MCLQRADSCRQLYQKVNKCYTLKKQERKSIEAFDLLALEKMSENVTDSQKTSES